MKKSFLFLLGISFILMSFNSNSELQYGYSTMTNNSEQPLKTKSAEKFCPVTLRATSSQYTRLRISAIQASSTIIVNKNGLKGNTLNQKIFDLD